MATAAQLRQFVTETFTVVPERSHGDELVFICLEPTCNDRSGNRSVNVTNGLTSCWRCGKGGPFVAWAKRLGYEPDFTEDAVTAANADELTDMLERVGTIGAVTKPSGYIPEVALPRGFTRVEDEPGCAYAKLIERMARRKHLELTDLVAVGVGFTRDDRLWEPFAIFPVNEWGRPVYYQGRTYTDPPKGETTKKFPSRNECPLSSKYWIYNLDEVRERGGKPVVVESILNVLSLKRELRRRNVTGYVPVSVFKHKMSGEQRVKLTQAQHQARERGLDVDEVIFMYDGRTRDEVERGVSGDTVRTAYRDAELLANNFKVSVVDMPDLVDANEDAVTAVDLLLRRQPYNQLDGLLLNLR